MKIGIFDSGLGGLHIANAIKNYLPKYNYVYLGDTMHVPYGRRSNEAIYNLTLENINYLFSQHDCALIVVACNTASAVALRRIQQEYLLENHPDRRVLGVIVPTLEHTIENKHKNIGMLATTAMSNSGIYEEELRKLDPEIKLHSMPAPLLVPLLEHDGDEFLDKALHNYVSPLLDKNIDSLILGCTHYCLLKDKVRALVGSSIDVISQDEIIPQKLHGYLLRHPEIETRLSKADSFETYVTDYSDSFLSAALKILGLDSDLDIHQVGLQSSKAA